MQTEKPFPLGAWVACRAAASPKADEALVGIVTTEGPLPIQFFVDKTLVEPSTLPLGDPIEAHLLVTVLSRTNGHSTIDVPGEPITFGPRVTVDTDLLDR
jgi:hypothetical protein